MSKVGSWSTTPGNNNSTPPDGWPEGQAPSTVNDCAREMMAQIRTLVSDLQYVDLNNTPSYLTSTSFSMGTEDTVNFHIGRRVKLFDASTLYGTVNSVSGTTVMVRLDSGALTASLSSVAVAIVTENNNSLPRSMAVQPNLFPNGQMEVWQRGYSFAPANSTTVFTADTWTWVQSSTAAVNITRGSDFPTVAQCGIRLNSCVVISVSAADATIASDEYAIFETALEGRDWRSLAHRHNALSFWVKSNRSGIYSLALRNLSAVASVCYIQNYTLTAVDTWTRFSMTIPEAPTTATWDYSSGSGLRVAFTIAAGSSRQAGGAGNWTAGDFLATSSQQNFLASASNVIKFTGIKLEPGTRATDLEVVPFDNALARCKRYYEKSYDYSVTPGAASTLGCGLVFQIGSGNIFAGGGKNERFQVEKAFTPTVTVRSPNSGAAGTCWDGFASVDRTVSTDGSVGLNGFFWFTGTMTANSQINLQAQWEAECKLP